MSIEDIADGAIHLHVQFADMSEVIARARLAATDDAQWSSKELKQLIRDLLRVTGL